MSAINEFQSEFQILNYFVDGYDYEKNIVIEYYEKYHKKPSQRKYDEKRKSEIINKLDCKFIEIWE